MNFPIILPNFSPVIFALGPLEVRWYSLAYIAGILFTWYLLKVFNYKAPASQASPIMSQAALDNWMFWAVLGVIIGGRVGYVLFYNWQFYQHHPAQIMAVWQGGMSFHGGLLGAIISMGLFSKTYQIKFFELSDILAIAAPIGLFFGRLANFINLELYGRVTDSKLGMVFPNAGNLPRHPSQLYEAFLEGLLLFIILLALAGLTKIRQKPGLLSGLFLILYALCRTAIEQFREPDEQIGLLWEGVTMGQLLSLPMVMAGLIIIIIALKSKTRTPQTSAGDKIKEEGNNQ